MAGSQGRNSGGGNKKQTPTRLQRRAPASIQVNQPSASDWKVVIPLLSPLVLSPTSPNPKLADRTADIKSREESSSRQGFPLPESERSNFKSWQHPAAPFQYEPAPSLKHTFVSRCR